MANMLLTVVQTAFFQFAIQITTSLFIGFVAARLTRILSQSFIISPPPHTFYYCARARPDGYSCLSSM